ncbi:MAG: FecR family protein, partial [Pyrinomonadaceae bacterium]
MFYFYQGTSLKQIGAIFILVFLASYAEGQNFSSATVLSGSGSVQISRPAGTGSNRLDVRVGLLIFEGDLVKTGSNGKLVIGLKDGSQAIISRDTTVEIKDANNSPRTIFNVLRGKTRIKIEKLGGKPNPYRITTPTTV